MAVQPVDRHLVPAGLEAERKRDIAVHVGLPAVVVDRARLSQGDRQLRFIERHQVGDPGHLVAGAVRAAALLERGGLDADHLVAHRQGQQVREPARLIHRHGLAIFEAYNRELSRHKQFNWDDFAPKLLEEAEAGRLPEDLRCDHGLIDEAQALQALQLKLLRLVARKSLTVAADGLEDLLARPGDQRPGQRQQAASHKLLLHPPDHRPGGEPA